MLMRLLMTCVMFLCLTGLTALVYRRLFPHLWAHGKKVAIGTTATFSVGFVVWAISWSLEVHALRFIGVTLTALGLVTTTILFLTMPAWASLQLVYRWREKRREAQLVDQSRRDLLRGAASALPAAAAFAGPVGTAAALTTPVINDVTIAVAGLDERLDGLQILQLTDVHLGTFINTDQVQAVVDAVKDAPPDLVVLTGDIADDYSKLPSTLEVVASLKPRLGAWACIGNHEIYRGRAAAEAIYAESEVGFLCDEGRLLEIGGARLWLCGADDPAKLGEDHRTFLEGSVERACRERPDDVHATLLLSHRPEGFEAAARRNVTLTLSGHTHGAQAAFFGRSWLEWLLPKSYLLGHYQAGDSHLYTSAGLGHWFPFRLNCPCEAALVTLKRA
jgi:predicted MPP superfamily phosphohydrolase